MIEPSDPVTLTAQIVSAYVSKNTISPADLTSLLREVHGALVSVVSNGPTEQVQVEPAVPIRRSISPDFVTCLVCGRQFKSLKRHINSHHQLSPEAYRAKFGLSVGHAIVAPNYAATRSRLAMKMGLGRPSGASRRQRRSNRS